jgi:hypothetical protein
MGNTGQPARFGRHAHWQACLTGSTLILLLTAAAIGNDRVQPWKVSALPSPVAGYSINPSLSPVAGGGILMTWTAQLPENRTALKGAFLRDGNWSGGFTVPTNADPAGQSSVALPDGSIVAQWTMRPPNATARFASEIYLARSRDEGRTWSAPLRVHDGNVEGEYGYASMLPHPNGDLTIAWLDPRRDGGTWQALYSRTLHPDGTFSPEIEVDDEACGCCPTSMARLANGLALAYRDHADSDIRDISVLRWVGGKWAQPVTVSHDGWSVKGCPGNGPAVAAIGDRLAVIWFTVSEGQRRIRLAGSLDGAKTFAWRKDIRSGLATGQPAITALDGDSFVAAWDEPYQAGGRLSAVTGTFDGSLGPVWEVARATSTRIGRPKAARYKNGVLFAWVDSESRKIQVAFGEPGKS